MFLFVLSFIQRIVHIMNVVIYEAWFPVTGVRDYIHVVDLAKGHVAALKRLEKGCGCKVSRQESIRHCSHILIA